MMVPFVGTLDISQKVHVLCHMFIFAPPITKMLGVATIGPEIAMGHRCFRQGHSGLSWAGIPDFKSSPQNPSGMGYWNTLLCTSTPITTSLSYFSAPSSTINNGEASSSVGTTSKSPMLIMLPCQRLIHLLEMVGPIVMSLGQLRCGA
jgi:hypothetical protein